jgi:hypothetical protein
MKIIHSALGLVDARKILSQGLRPPKETGKSWYPYTRDSDIISFIALKEWDGTSRWGDYHFVLNPEWFRQHITQFREHSDEDSDRYFQRFVKEKGLQPYLGDFKKTWNQILSLKPVPVEGLDELVIPDSELVFFKDIEIPQNIEVKTYVKSV